MMRIVDVLYQGQARCAVVDSSTQLRLLSLVKNTYQVMLEAIKADIPIQSFIASHRSNILVDYDQAMDSQNILVPCMHPDPAHCYVTGTGLTHTGSADARDAMHTALKDNAENLSDSMKMFQMGIEGGKPEENHIGAEPEWFYKGDGDTVVPAGQTINIPDFAEDAGEEPEIAVIYIIDGQGNPVRIGYAIGNELSDHVKEKRNYLLLAHSKLRPCSIGPEIYLGDLPKHLEGTSRIIREGNTLWEKTFVTGEDNMVHSIDNLMHHHFKYQQFKRPGDLHIHFLGTATLSYADNIVIKEGDEIEISLPDLGRALKNRIHFLNN